MARIVAQKENDWQRVILWDQLGDSAPFARANVHADILQRLNVDLPAGEALAVGLTKGEYRVDYDIETETLNIGCDETDTIGDDNCHGEVGAPLEGSLSTGMLAANIYYCSGDRILTRIEQYLETFTTAKLDFFVYEAHEDPILATTLFAPAHQPEPGTRESYGVIDPSSDHADERHRLVRTDFQGPFDLLARAVVEASPAGRRFHSSGAIQVPLREGRFYLIGVAWAVDAMSFWGASHPTTVPFGHSLRGLSAGFSGELQRTLMPTTNEDLTERPLADERAYHQILSLDGRGVEAAERADLYILDTSGVQDLRVGTVNVTDAGVAKILTNVAIGKVIGGPPPQFFDGSIDPPESPVGQYAVKVNEIIYRTKDGSPEPCRCHRKLYREPEGWREFPTEAEALEYYDSLEPIPRAAIGVTEGGLDVAGCMGGPFSPESVTFVIENTGQFEVAWTAEASEPWLSVSSAGGVLANPGDQGETTVSLNDAAKHLCTGRYSATVVITNTTNGVGTASRDFRIEVRGEPTPQLEPPGGLESEGRAGGPFSPASATWTLANTDGCPMTWEAEHSASWVQLSDSGGTLPAGGSISIEVSLAAEASGLTPGRYGDRVVFRNLTSGRESVGRDISLLILP